MWTDWYQRRGLWSQNSVQALTVALIKCGILGKSLDFSDLVFLFVNQECDIDFSALLGG